MHPARRLHHSRRRRYRGIEVMRDVPWPGVAGCPVPVRSDNSSGPRRVRRRTAARPSSA
jgi:hypothetical protein